MSARIYRFRRRYRAFKRNVAIVVIAVSVGVAFLSEHESTGSGSYVRGGDAWNGPSDRRSTAFTKTPNLSSPGAVLIDRVTRVRDGDTIVVGLIPIRIANLDCDEAGTRAGDTATMFAKQLLAGEALECRLEGRRSYDREVGVCALSDGRDFGEVLISEGMCRRWK